MGARSIKMPDVGEGMAEAEIVEWHVKVGDVVREDQVVAAVMTDKATVEIPAPFAGTVLALGSDIGQMIAIGAELIRIEVPGEADMIVGVTHAPATPVPAPSQPAAPTSGPVSGPAPSDPAGVAQMANKPLAAKAAGPGAFVGLPRPVGEKPLAAPSIRARTREAGIDLRNVTGTGPAGRILHDDVDRFIASGGRIPSATAGKSANLGIEEIKVVGLRRRIAQNMAESKRRVAHFSYVEEVDVTALEDLRAELNRDLAKGRSKLTVLPFIMLALVKALRDFPQMNAHYDDEANLIRRIGAAHLGIATQTQSGLMVPVVRHAETLSIWDCAAEIKRLSDAAREGTASREDLSGSTITITSLGALGGIVTTPVVNRPEVAIIGINKVMVRPVWRETAFVPRKIMNLSSSFDHRVVDGYDAALFVQRIRGFIETPALIFMEA
jgi:2-oxoisovalerate dehydrogenase E2 component (dihydrolipoyl transacylase)